MAVEDDAEKIGVKLFHHVVGTVVGKSSSPILKHPTHGAIFRRVVDRRNALLEQLASHLGNIERRIAGVGARDDCPGGGVADTRPDRTLTPSEISGVVVQDMGQKTKDKERRCGLIPFRRAEAFRVGPPPFAIVRLAIGGLLKAGLEQIAEMRAEIYGLMPSENVLFLDGQRRLILWGIVFGLEIRNDAENALGILVLLSGGVRRRTRGGLGTP